MHRPRERVRGGVAHRTGARRGRRLCVVVHGPYPVGEPRVAREVRVALAEGFEVDVVAMRGGADAAREVVGGARVWRLPLVHRRGAGVARVVSEYVGFAALATLVVGALSLVRRYEAVHVNNPPDFLVVAALVPKLLGARVIFDVHDLSSDMFAMRFQGKPGAQAADRILRSLERWAARIADVVITVHEPYREELVARGIPAAKTAVVMNAVDDHVLPEPAGEPERESFLVVYHGTVTPEYGVELLVEAAARVVREVRELSVAVYGEGDSVPRARERARELGIAAHVHFSDRYIPQIEVLELVRDAHVGVIPNLATRLNRFALSSKLFEYVALGVPVVSADLPTIRAHFGDDEVLFFAPGDPDALAEAILTVRRHPEAAAERAAAARRRYEQYRWSVSAQRYAEALSG